MNDMTPKAAREYYGPQGNDQDGQLQHHLIGAQRGGIGVQGGETRVHPPGFLFGKRLFSRRKQHGR